MGLRRQIEKFLAPANFAGHEEPDDSNDGQTRAEYEDYIGRNLADRILHGNIPNEPDDDPGSQDRD